MENFELFIGKCLRLGTLISFIIIIAGGIFYFYQHGSDRVNDHIFRGEPVTLTAFTKIVPAALSFSTPAIIQLGLFALVLVQILRVALTCWYLFKLPSKILTICGLFVLAVMLANFIFKI